jgi:hypothetical protein
MWPFGLEYETLLYAAPSNHVIDIPFFAQEFTIPNRTTFA